MYSSYIANRSKERWWETKVLPDAADTIRIPKQFLNLNIHSEVLSSAKSFHHFETGDAKGNATHEKSPIRKNINMLSTGATEIKTIVLCLAPRWRYASKPNLLVRVYPGVAGSREKTRHDYTQAWQAMCMRARPGRVNPRYNEDLII